MYGPLQDIIENELPDLIDVREGGNGIMIWFEQRLKQAIVEKNNILFPRVNDGLE